MISSNFFRSTTFLAMIALCLAIVLSHSDTAYSAPVTYRADKSMYQANHPQLMSEMVDSSEMVNASHMEDAAEIENASEEEDESEEDAADIEDVSEEDAADIADASEEGASEEDAANIEDASEEDASEEDAAEIENASEEEISEYPSINKPPKRDDKKCKKPGFFYKIGKLFGALPGSQNESTC